MRNSIWESEVTQLCLTLCNPVDCSPPGSSVHGDSPSKNTGVGCHFLLQGIFLTQGTSPGLPHFRQTLYHLSKQGCCSVNRHQNVNWERQEGTLWRWIEVRDIRLTHDFMHTYTHAHIRIHIHVYTHVHMNIYTCICICVHGCIGLSGGEWHPTPVLLPGKSHGWRNLAVHGVAKSWTRLSDFTFTFHFHALEKEMATHSSVLAWKIPGTGEPGGLPSMGSHRVGHD